MLCFYEDDGICPKCGIDHNIKENKDIKMKQERIELMENTCPICLKENCVLKDCEYKIQQIIEEENSPNFNNE
jgi:hypothetical protein